MCYKYNFSKLVTVENLNTPELQLNVNTEDMLQNEIDRLWHT